MSNVPIRRFVLLSVTAMFAVAAIPSAARGQEKGEKKLVAKKIKKPIYDEQADAKADIAAAVARAKKDNKRVLVMYGGNWCGWCYKLHDVFKKDRKVARTLLYEYERVMVDIGRMDKHQDIVKGYGAKIKGVPFLTVLDGDGEVVVNQPTDPLEDGDHHDPNKVQAFLSKHKAEPWDAKELFDKALARAESQGKMVFMHFGAPWCGWCRKLEAFLDQDEVAAIMNRDFVDLKIDIDRMTGGKDIQAKYQPTSSGGIPWFAFLDSTGEVLATSNRENGRNVGFPVDPDEIAHFIDMLTKTRKNISADDTAKMKVALEASARKIKGGRGG